MSEIRYCPVCGSENIQKQPLKPGSELTLLKDDTEQEATDYYCEDCKSNGDIDIVVYNREVEEVSEDE